MHVWYTTNRFKHKKRRIRRDKKRRIRRDMKRRIRLSHRYIHFDPKWIKKGLVPTKNPQNDEYVFFQLKNKNIFPQTAIFQELKYIYTTNRFKYKKRTIRREG